MKFELFISQRLQLKRDSQSTTSPSVYIAVCGIALALIVMMLSICIVLGFKHQIRDKVMGFSSHITVNPTDSYGDGIDGTLINFTDTLRTVINSAGVINKMSLTFDLPGILKTDTDFKGVVLRGMSTDGNWDFVASNLTEGAIPDYSNDSNKNKVIISRLTASALNVGINDKINAYFFKNNNVKARRFEIAGIYETHFSDYDNIYLFAPISLPQSISDVSSTFGTSINLQIPNITDIETSSYSIQDALTQACYEGHLAKLYTVDNVLRTGMLYFNWLELLDTNVVVILVLMALVSGFTLISCLFILILERVNMIGTMKALGATNAQIGRIFINLAERLVVLGLIIGNIIGIGFLLLQSHFRFLTLDAEAYYLNYVPIEINWWYILLLNFGIIIASYIMLLLPSRLVSRISPATAIQYE